MTSTLRKLGSANGADADELLALMLDQGNDHSPAAMRILGRKKDSPALPMLSFAQQRLWFLDRLEPGNTSYNIFLTLRLRGELNIAALDAALQQIVARHDALRSRFCSERGAPIVRIEPHVSVPLRRIDHSSLAEEAAKLALERLSEDEARTPFDLSDAPLLRAALVRRTESDHMLLLTIHHIVCDGWSMGVITRELAELYEGYASGGATSLRPLPIQYTDFAAWQREWLQADRLERLLTYWKGHLADLPGPLALPFDRSMGPSSARSGDSLDFRVDTETMDGVRSLCRQSGTSVFSALLAAFAVLLHRYGGEKRVVIGVPYANRTFKEVEPLIGFFVNTLPLCIDLSGTPTFLEVLNRVGHVTDGAFAHQDLPFEKIVEGVQPDRSPTRNPIFQVLLAFQNAPIPPLALMGLDVKIEMDRKTCRFDLELHVWHGSQGELLGRFCYPSALFDGSTIERLRTHWTNILKNVTANPSPRIGDVDYLSAVERIGIHTVSEGTRIGDPGLRLHEIFSEQAGGFPNRVALRCGLSQWTYRTLDAHAARLASVLRRRGVGVDDRVGIFCDRSLWMWASVLAVLRVGAAYVPIDPGHPATRSQFILRESGAKIVLTQRALAGLALEDARRIIVVDDTALVSGTRVRATVPVTRDSLFCVLYTSGSTGTPKGVCLTHGLVEDTVRRYSDGPPRETLHFAPLGFDVSLEETFPAWCVGGTAVIVPSELRRDVRALSTLLAERRVERAIFPVTWLQQLAEIPMDSGAYALSEIVATGEQLRVSDTMRDWFGRLKTCRLRNVYGPTEAQVVTDWLLPLDPTGWSTLPSIGSPIPNSSGFVLGQYLDLLPTGVEGELWAKPETSSRGYMGQPGLTAERFLPCPWGTPGSRMYRTGDVVRWLPEGLLEFKGRRDGQIKIRGFRVETGEIEAQLLRHPSVRGAVVLCRQDGSGSLQLVAAVTGNDGLPSPSALIAHLRAELPDYMVPFRILVLDRFPLNANGKVDRNALSEKAAAETNFSGDRRAPASPMEKTVATVWASVLGLGQIARGDDFFALGGHSLRATQVASRLEEVLGREIPVRLLFECPVLEGLASSLERIVASNESTSAYSLSEREEFDL